MPSILSKDQLKISYADEGQGIPVVLLHGYCGDSRYFDEVIPLLAWRFRVIAPDCRGHGESGATEGAYSMDRLAQDVVDLLDELGIERAFVLGHSMGGYAALALAEKHPNRLLGFGLLHSTSYPDDEAGRAGREKVAKRVAEEGITGHINDLIPKLFAAEHRSTMPEKLDFAREIGYRTSPLGAIGGALGMKERPDRTSVLEQTAVPVLLLAGEADEVIGPAKRFPASGPLITQVTLPQSGHMGMLEKPLAFAQTIVEYVDRAMEARGKGPHV
ncbi:alpha/beta fold hydrolase [Cohnella sp. AR92]|uniref:alpha/beta fold hydrolase n=1 Tax=Cohnella sp. AR92 TaxID=648716 RepID=UPI000F8C3EB2|nr:alpha/beta hydrolase [Cohnella sp. AR92]RUS47764.1 alpha/beta hydrolase [Cohnella sp. AR92]